jgi:hypothetical protein
MSAEGQSTIEGPPKRRDSWSLKTIVEDVAGRPITDLQDPSRPTHPYLKLKPSTSARASPTSPMEDGEDPVGRVYPPLTGATGRALHGADREHDPRILSHFEEDPSPASPGVPHHTPGPSRRPERIYLHYLLLHLDRLSDTALAYLRHAVEEETTHRSSETPPPALPGSRGL